MRNNSCRQLLFDLFQMLKWRTKQEQSQTCLSYALQGGIRRSQMTEQREQNSSLLEFCRIATIRQSQMVGQRDNGTKGHLCFRFFNSDKNGLLKLLYILLIYILIIYIIIHIRPFIVLPHSFLTMQKPFVPMSQCPNVPFFLYYPRKSWMFFYLNPAIGWMPVWYLNPYPWQKLNDFLLTLVCVE